MDLTYIRILNVIGIFVVALVATAGVMVVSLLAAWLVRVAHALGAWFARVGESARPTEPRVAPTAGTRVAAGNLELDPGAHALLARQAWWRLRC